MKILAVSDFHGYLPEVPDCDLLLIGGDVTPVWNHDKHFQKQWLKSEFNFWLINLAARGIPVVGIAGNHDFYAQQNPGFMSELAWIYLQDETVEVNGLKIHGSPWVTNLTGWAFCTTEDVMGMKLDDTPHDIDILLSHAPPYGIKDSLAYGDFHIGSTTLTNRLVYEEWPNLKHVIFGHIHEAYGHENIKDINFWNVSYLNEKYDSDNPNGVTEISI